MGGKPLSNQESKLQTHLDYVTQKDLQKYIQNLSQ